MPISVQLPGYNRSSPLLNGIQAINGISQAYQGYKKSQLDDAQTANENLKNEDLQRQTDAQKAYTAANADPSSPVSKQKAISASALLNGLQSSGQINPDQKSALQTSLLGSNASDQGPAQPQQLSGAKIDQWMNSTGLAQLLKQQSESNSQDSKYQQAIDAAGIKADAAISAAGVRGANTGRNLEERQNQNASKVGHEYEADPIIKTSKTSLNSLDRSQSILTNPDKPVTTKDLNLAYNDYINAVAAGGAATEGKIHREMPETFEQQWNDLKQKMGAQGGNIDLRQSDTGRSLIAMLQQNIGTVQNDLQGAISNQANNIHSNYLDSTNQKVRSTNDRKFQEYTNSGQPQPHGLPAPAPHGQTIKQGDHTFNWNSQTGKYE